MAKILVVDDDADTRSLFREALTPAGHEVRTAGDGLAALRVLATWRPDLLLIDGCYR